MKTRYKIIIAVLSTVFALFIFLWHLSTVSIPVLDPSGLIALKEKKLIVISTLLMLIVVIPVFAMMIYFAWKYREGNTKAEYKPDWSHSYLAETIWWGVPIVIIAVLALITWKSSHELDPYKPISSSENPIKIQVVALDWKWLFIYPDYKIATINLMQFPEKTPISLDITSDAPMNSFWIPDLSGQIYGMPGMKTQLHIIADKQGSYRGCSAQINGIGFAGMVFEAKACSEKEFDAWVNEVKSSGTPLNKESYKTLTKQSQYDPVKYFSLKEKDLFHQIIMKYNVPKV